MHLDRSPIQRSSILEALRLTFLKLNYKRTVGSCDVCDVIWLKHITISNAWAECELPSLCSARLNVASEKGNTEAWQLTAIWKHTREENALLSMTDKQKSRIYTQTQRGHSGGEQKGRWGIRTHGGRSKGNSRELKTWQISKLNHNIVCFFRR